MYTKSAVVIRKEDFIFYLSRLIKSGCEHFGLLDLWEHASTQKDFRLHLERLTEAYFKDEVYLNFNTVDGSFHGALARLLSFMRAPFDGVIEVTVNDSTKEVEYIQFFDMFVEYIMANIEDRVTCRLPIPHYLKVGGVEGKFTVKVNYDRYLISLLFETIDVSNTEQAKMDAYVLKRLQELDGKLYNQLVNEYLEQV